ncbi:MAG TPA: tryptophan synthase subunit alpha [Thermoanaerobaculia bacterium]
MNRIKKLFRDMKRCGVIAYITCGDPTLEATLAIAADLEAAGADAIELGIPFSDPIADGPVIQAASQRALANHVSVEDVLRVAKTIRARSEIPLIAFSYSNPILHYGIERFAERAAESGIDATLITDLPPESAKGVRATLKKQGVGMIFLLAPTSPPDRVKLVEKMSDGFVYYVSTTGVTGARKELDPTLLVRLDEVRRQIKKPLAVGFGVSTREHYEMLAPHCDAVVVGSAIVKAIAAGERAGDVLRGIRG